MKNNLQWPATANCLRVCLLFLLPLAASAQQKDSLKFNNRKYKYEVGIDMQGIFNNYLGTALIFKIRNDRGKFIPVSYAKNYRIQWFASAGLSGEDQVTDLDTFSNATISSSNQYDNLHLSAFVGMEKVHFSGKFNFYYGLDLGPSYSYWQTGYQIREIQSGSYTTTITSTVGDPNESHAIGVNVAPFFGVKYRFNERFSASAETAFFAAYAFISETRYLIEYSGSTAQFASRIQTHRFSMYMDYLRFLTFNYHFG